METITITLDTADAEVVLGHLGEYLATADEPDEVLASIYEQLVKEMGY